MSDQWRKGTAAALLALLVVAAWGISQWSRARHAEGMLGAQFQHSFFQLLGSVKNAEVSLSKARAAGSADAMGQRFLDVWYQAQSAQAHLNMLPLAMESRLRTSTFLTQAGDFAYSLAARAARGAQPGEEDQERLLELQRQLGKLADDLQEVLAAAARGPLPWRDLQRLASARLDRQDPNPFATRFNRIEEDLTEVPTLLYDGPFSDHVTRRTPRWLPEEVVTQEEARQTAADFLSKALGRRIDPDAVQFQTEVDAPLATYRFQWQEGRRPPVRIDVAQRGGQVVWMIDNREPGEPTVGREEAIQRAQQLLASLGFEAMEPVFPLHAAGRVMVPFAPVQDGVVLYPDQIKLTIALDNGQLLTYYALDYLMNHHPRDMVQPALTEAEARRRLNPRLKQDGDGRLVWMMDETLKEFLAWEFPVTMDGDHYLVYLDAHSGEELRIERVVRTEEGLLVM